ncbi:MAG: AMP-binding protein, partial [Acidimicrobiaceae bacterium]|nr:AMP-binding protein [Acidimicrobiaceae bacterium]
MPEFAAALAAADPHAVALADHYRDLTWTEVNDTLNRCANLLLAMDLGPKRRVSIFAENAGETALAHLGGLLAGCSTVPVNFHLTAEEAAYIVSDSESQVIFCDDSTVLIEGNQIMRNTATDAGGIGIRSCSADIVRNVICQNSVSQFGGGLDIQ